MKDKTKEEEMKIVLDTQGGDKSPEEIIRGGVNFALKSSVKLAFAGSQEVIETELKKHPQIKQTDYSVIYAPEIITMADNPLKAIRRKKRSSLVMGIKAVKDGLADAFVSPANTGAVMAASLLFLKRIVGIERPGIAASLPTLGKKKILIIDAGANTDCSPETLLGFALMGKVYAQEIWGIINPSLGLLSTGEESGKGSRLVKDTHALLKSFDFLNFKGNVEPAGILNGEVDVAICDGSIGNVMLKGSEAGAAFALKLIKNKIVGFKATLGAWFLKSAFKEIKSIVSPAQYGGAPLLGIRGIVVIAHGHSGAEAIANALAVAQNAYEHQLIQKLENGLKNISL